jgi:ATP-dependent DNA ligase
LKASLRSVATVSMSPASAPAPGPRSGSIVRDFVIGGYTLGGRHFDGLIFGYWEGDQLMYAARTRSGFTPTVREQLHQRFAGPETPECPFANLPEARAGRWGEGLTAAKMKDCWWLKPVLVGQFEFVEWTPLRHSRFVALQDTKEGRELMWKGVVCPNCGCEYDKRGHERSSAEECRAE